MMLSARLEAMAEQAAAVGARVNRTGDGSFVILHGGQRHPAVSLRAVEVVLRQLDGAVAAQVANRLRAASARAAGLRDG